MAGGLVLIFLAVVAFGSATIGDILASKGRPHPRPRGILRRMFQRSEAAVLGMGGVRSAAGEEPCSDSKASKAAR